MYEDFFEDGRKYLKTARGGLKRPSVFTEEILYNILLMSIEKNIMGILIFHGDMADNHTVTDLLDSLGRVLEIDKKVIDDLLEFERYQTICSVFDGYQRKKMTFEVIERMIETATIIENHASAVYACHHESPA
jgi:HEPN domain-containing protein